MQRVNDVANMWDCKIGLPPSDPDACAVDADMSGAIASPLTTKQFCDRVIADDAVLKLRLAAMHTPFFLAVGFRKPHLPFRFPAPFLALVEGDVAAHPTLSPTVPPIAHHDAVPQPHIYTPVANARCQTRCAPVCQHLKAGCSLQAEHCMICSHSRWQTRRHTSGDGTIALL